MPGYKNTIRQDNPVSFWTFDGDLFDPSSKRLNSETGMIIDEMGNKNPGKLFSDTLEFMGYEMGHPSMIEREPIDNHSIVFAPYGAFPSYSSIYPRSWIEIPHSVDYEFTEGFSVEFMFRKNSLNYPEAGTHLYTRPLINKAGLFKVWLQTMRYSPTQIRFSFFDSESSKWIIDTFPFNKETHVVMTYKVIQDPAGHYGEGRVYMDGKELGMVTFDLTQESADMTVGTPLFLSNDPLASASLHQRQNTDPLFFDQVALYDYALLPEQVGRHWSKIYFFQNMVSRTPNIWRHWRLDESAGDASPLVTDAIAGTQGTLYGLATKERLGPSQITGSSGILFQDGAQLVFGGRGFFFNSNEYTIEMWLKTSQTYSGVVFSLRSPTFPFNGYYLLINNDGQGARIGALTYSESMNLSTTATDFPIGERWVHTCITRVADEVSIYFDGVKHNSFIADKVSVSGDVALMFMNTPDGDKPLVGELSNIAIYTRGLQEHEIKARSGFSHIYYIRGKTTVRGAPYKATLRAYDHITGELIKEMESETSDGTYVLTLHDNRKIDLMVYSKDDINVRYRTYGPITPAEAEDFDG